MFRHAPPRPALGYFIALLVLTYFTSISTAQEHRPSILEQFRTEASRLKSSTQTVLGREFLAAIESLPDGEARIIYRKPGTRQFLSPSEVNDLGESARAELKMQEVTADQFYTKYGTPLAYTRAVDLLGSVDLVSLNDRRILDFGYGGVGHLRMLALIGGEVTGVDVDSYLNALYSAASDQGPQFVKGRRRGTVRLVHGHWPGDANTHNSVGNGFDVFLAKNVLKRGYIHPEREAEDRFLIQLGVDDATFCQAIYDALNPGGIVLIYNLCPAQNPPDKKYIPWGGWPLPVRSEVAARRRAGGRALRR